jgi:hypothetical protein
MGKDIWSDSYQLIVGTPQVQFYSFFDGHDWFTYNEKKKP